MSLLNKTDVNMHYNSAYNIWMWCVIYICKITNWLLKPVSLWRIFAAAAHFCVLTHQLISWRIEQFQKTRGRRGKRSFVNESHYFQRIVLPRGHLRELMNRINGFDWKHRRESRQLFCRFNTNHNKICFHNNQLLLSDSVGRMETDENNVTG